MFAIEFEKLEWETFTSPRYRGRHISRARQSQMLRYFGKSGCRRIIAAILPENKAVFRALAKTGYREVGMIGYMQIGPFRYDFMRMRRGAGPPSVMLQ